MRNGIVALLLLAFAVPAYGQAVARPRAADPEVVLLNGWRGGAMTAQTVGGHVLPARPFTVTGITFYNSTAAGTATGTMVIRVTDETRNCDWTVDCTTNDARATGAKRGTPSGTCTFPAASVLRFTIQTQCATAQPSALNATAVGYWN